MNSGIIRSTILTAVAASFLAVVPILSGIWTPSVWAEEGGAASLVNVPYLSVSGTVVLAAELGEAYYVSVERPDVPEGVQNKVVLSMSPESRITIGGEKRTPDDFLRMVNFKEDQATAVYYVNSEGMKHVVSISVEPRR